MGREWSGSSSSEHVGGLIQHNLLRASHLPEEGDFGEVIQLGSEVWGHCVKGVPCLSACFKVSGCFLVAVISVLLAVYLLGAEGTLINNTQCCLLGCQKKLINIVRQVFVEDLSTWVLLSGLWVMILWVG